MLDIMRKGQRWLTAIFVVGIGLVFAVFIGTGQPLTPGQINAVIAVGDDHVSVDEYSRMRRRQEQLYQDAFGENFDARRLRDQIDTVTTRTLIERVILAQEAEKLGLTVAKPEIERSLLADPGLRDADGRFDQELFRNWVEREFGSERVFREELRRAELAKKLIRVVSTQAVVSEGEARLAARQRLEQVRVAFPILSPASLAADEPRDDAAIAAYVAANGEALQALYDERIDQYDVPEQARARHILVAVPATASDDAVAERESFARELRQRLIDGEDFATVAGEVSEDPGSAANGGDLGWFRRGQMVPEFDAAAFTLPEGELSEPIRTNFGFHLVRVEERKQAQTQTLADVQDDLADELLKRDVGLEKARALAEQLAAAVRGGESLEDAARAAELTLERTDWLKRRPDGFIPGLGAAPDVLSVAFTLAPGESSDRVFEVGDQLTLVQVLERQEPDDEEFADELALELERLRQSKLEARIGSWVDARRAALNGTGELFVNPERL